MPLKEVYKMTWAEFELRSFAFWEERELDLLLRAKSDYKIYCMNFMYSKTKPVSFKVFAKKEYGIDVKDSRTSRVTDEHKAFFLKEMQKYNKAKNG